MTMHFAPPGAQARASALLRTVPMYLWPQAVRDRRARLAAGLRRLEDLREEFVAKLDALTGDPDLEPSLGAPEYPSHLSKLSKGLSTTFAWSRGSNDDREADGSGFSFSGHTDADFEPSLGAPDWTQSRGGRDQTRWALGGGYDLELANEDSEHSLGWRESDSLTGRLGLGSDEREETSEDEGAQCDDEGVEDGREPEAEGIAFSEWSGPVHHVELAGAAATYWAVPRASG